MASDVKDTITITLTLPFDEARALAQFFRRATLPDYQAQADSRGEATRMLSAAAALLPKLMQS